MKKWHLKPSTPERVHHVVDDDDDDYDDSATRASGLFHLAVDDRIFLLLFFFLGSPASSLNLITSKCLFLLLHQERSSAEEWKMSIEEHYTIQTKQKRMKDPKASAGSALLF